MMTQTFSINAVPDGVTQLFYDPCEDINLHSEKLRMSDLEW